MISRTLYLFPILLSLLLFSCQKEHLDGELPDVGRTEVSMIAENGLDLTPFMHLDKERLAILRELEFPEATRAVDFITMYPESTEIPGLGQTRTFTLSGNSMANNVEVIVREIYDGEIARVTAANVGTTSKTASIYFPPYYDLGGSSRVYILEYSENGGTSQTFGVLLQNPIDANFVTNLQLFDYTISKNGGVVAIYKEGSYPATIGDYVEFRFALNHNPDNFISTVTLSNPSQGQIDIQVPVNTGQARSLTLYMRGPNSDWIIVDHCTQLGTGGSANVLTDWVVTRTSADPLTVYGGTALVGISGDYSGLEVRLWTTNSLGQELTTSVQTLNKGEYPSNVSGFDLSPYDGALAFQVPAFEDNGWAYNLDRRYLYHSGNSFVWYAQVNTGDGWKIIGSNTHGSNQLPQPWSRISISETLDYAPRAYSTWPVQVSGYWENQTSNRLVHLWVVTDPFNPEGTVLGIARLDPRTMGMSPSVVQLDVPANKTGKVRTLYVVFSLDEGRTWNRWYSGWNGNGSITQQAL